MATQKEWLSWAEDKADLVRDLIIFLIWTLKVVSFYQKGSKILTFSSLKIEIPRDLC
jgi:hypothetical protein